ncbi:hypothetical protein CPB85DRAFT_1303097 [Mucidula mucida]|nr:hypothetical protein CPB85DRAFT_1303097 [Mucidula mucida]
MFFSRIPLCLLPLPPMLLQICSCLYLTRSPIYTCPAEAPHSMSSCIKNLKGLESLRFGLLQKDEPGTIVTGTMVQSNVQTWVSRRAYRDSAYDTLFDSLTLP